MSDWKEKTIDDVCFIDKECLSSNTDPSYQFTYISLSDVDRGRILSSKQRITYGTAPSRARRILHDNDVLMATVRPNLQAFALLGEGIRDMIGSTGFAVLSEKDQNSNGYVYHYLFSDHATKQINTLVAGSNYPAISSTDVKRLKIRIPDLRPEQRKIARILSTVDAVIEKTEAAIAKYKAIKQGMMRDLFTRGLDASGRLRPRYEDAPHLYKQTELGWVPKEWEVVVFGEQVELVHGHQFRNYDFTEVGVPVVKIGQVKPENIDLSDCSYIDNARMDEFKNETIVNGDVLMALTGATLGKACIVRNLAGPILQNYRVGRFEPKSMECRIDKTFLYYTLIEGDLLNQILNRVNSGAQGNIGKADFEKAIFKKPSFVEQNEMAKKLLAIDRIIQTEQISARKQMQLKQGLMSDLLTGRKPVKCDDQEVV